MKFRKNPALCKTSAPSALPDSKAGGTFNSRVSLVAWEVAGCSEDRVWGFGKPNTRKARELELCALATLLRSAVVLAGGSFKAGLSTICLFVGGVDTMEAEALNVGEPSPADQRPVANNRVSHNYEA